MAGKFRICLTSYNEKRKSMSTRYVIIIKSVFNMTLLPISGCRVCSNNVDFVHSKRLQIGSISWGSCLDRVIIGREEINFYGNIKNERQHRHEILKSHPGQTSLFITRKLCPINCFDVSESFIRKFVFVA